MVYKMNLAAVRNAGLPGEENAGVVITSHDRRILQSVLTVVRNARFRSSLTELDLSTAESALAKEDPKDQGSVEGDPIDQTEDTK